MFAHTNPFLHKNIHLTELTDKGTMKKLLIDVMCLLFNAGGKVEFREDLGSLSIFKAH